MTEPEELFLENLVNKANAEGNRVLWISSSDHTTHRVIGIRERADEPGRCAYLDTEQTTYVALYNESLDAFLHSFNVTMSMHKHDDSDELARMIKDAIQEYAHNRYYGRVVGVAPGSNDVSAERRIHPLPCRGCPHLHYYVDSSRPREREWVGECTIESCECAGYVPIRSKE